MEGNVTTISQQNNAVEIDGVWYNLASHVKMTYVKKGACSFTVSDEPVQEGQNKVITYIKSASTGERGTGNIQNPNSNPDVHANSEMNRMSALKFAGNVYMGTGQEDDAKRLAEEAHVYLQKGMWITTEKPTQNA